MLTINGKAGCGALGAIRIRVELTSVARFVFCPDLFDGQLSVAKATAHADPPDELICYAELAVLPIGGHGGGVALFGCLHPQHLLHPNGEAVPAGEGGRLPAYCRPIALYISFT